MLVLLAAFAVIPLALPWLVGRIGSRAFFVAALLPVVAFVHAAKATPEVIAGRGRGDGDGPGSVDPVDAGGGLGLGEFGHLMELGRGALGFLGVLGELLDVVVPAFLHAAVLNECGQLVHREVIDGGTIIGQRLVVLLGRVNPDRDDFLLGIHVGQGVAAGLVAGGDLVGIRVVDHRHGIRDVTGGPAGR